jgi:hypothetical protein
MKQHNICECQLHLDGLNNVTTEGNECGNKKHYDFIALYHDKCHISYAGENKFQKNAPAKTKKAKKQFKFKVS